MTVQHQSGCLQLATSISILTSKPYSWHQNPIAALSSPLPLGRTASTARKASLAFSRRHIRSYLAASLKTSTAPTDHPKSPSKNGDAAQSANPAGGLTTPKASG